MFGRTFGIDAELALALSMAKRLREGPVGRGVAAILAMDGGPPDSQGMAGRG